MISLFFKQCCSVYYFYKTLQLQITNENSRPYLEDVVWFWRGILSTLQLFKVGQCYDYLGWNYVIRSILPIVRVTFTRKFKQHRHGKKYAILMFTKTLFVMFLNSFIIRTLAPA